jgi:aromatic amino acid aminotransferase I / 2-aminoadipate transaminase
MLNGFPTSEANISSDVTGWHVTPPSMVMGILKVMGILTIIQCDSIAFNFTLVPVTNRSVPGAAGLVVFSKDDATLTTPLFSFIPPMAGMFIWARFYYSGSSRFRVLQADETCVDPEAVFETEIWAEMAKALVLLTPGSYYEPWQGKKKTTTKSRGGETGIGYFRLAYSLVTV